MVGSLTPLSLLMPAFSLPATPRRLTTPLHATGTLSYRVQCPQACTPIASEASLSPVELSAPEHLTSELLRTLSRVAASKPTSWLSGRSHHLSHYSPHLGALAGGLGCFPLDDESSHPPSHSPWRLVAFAVWLESVSAEPPRPSSALPPRAVAQEG